MSDRPMMLPPPAPMMTPEQARDLARSLKGMADQAADLGDLGLARISQRQSEWYLAYALVLAHTPTEAP